VEFSYEVTFNSSKIIFGIFASY